MNILVLSWRDPRHPRSGGAEQVMHEHMKGWVKAGHRVTLFSSRLPGYPKSEKIEGVKIIRAGYQYLGVQVAGFFYWLRNGKRYDLVVDQFHGIPFFTPIYVRKPKLAVLQEVAHEVWFTNPLIWPVNWIIGIIGYLSEFIIFQFYRSTPFMVGSCSAKDDLKKMGIPPRKIVIVPHGVIINKLKPMPRKEDHSTLIFLGALTKDKGIEDTIKCFGILAEQSDYRFWIVGKAESSVYFAKLKRLVEKLGIKGKTRFWGFVDQNKKFELLAKAHVLVNPSIREGWGLVNIEANAVGTPVTGYCSPGLVDSIRDGVTGIITKENTPAELASEISDLLDNTEKMDKLRKGAVAWSRKFSWERSKELSLDYLEKVQNGRA